MSAPRHVPPLALVPISVFELSALVALLRHGPLEPAGLATTLSNWFGVPIAVDQVEHVLRSIAARRWLNRRAGGSMLVTDAYGPVRMLCAGMLRMLGDPEPAGHGEQLPLNIFDGERNGS